MLRAYESSGMRQECILTFKELSVEVAMMDVRIVLGRKCQNVAVSAWRFAPVVVLGLETETSCN